MMREAAPVPQMFIERSTGAISKREWRLAAEAAGGRLVDPTLDVALPDEDGTWVTVLRWIGDSAELSMMRFHEPYRARVIAIARALDAQIVDAEGARYL